MTPIKAKIKKVEIATVVVEIDWDTFTLLRDAISFAGDGGMDPFDSHQRHKLNVFVSTVEEAARKTSDLEK